MPAKINSTTALSVTFDFSEDVTGFVTGDVTVAGGTKGAFSGSGRSYTLAVTPTSGSNVTVTVAADAATDGLNTGPASAVTATATWDAAAPTVEIGGVPAKINSTAALSVTFDFSEDVTGFVTGDVTVTGGTKGAFSGSGREYTLAVTPTSGSNVTVEVAANSATDGLNTGPASAVTATAVWDAAAPTVTIGGVPAKINSTTALSVTFDFSEAVTGFVTGDVTVAGGTKGAFSGSGRSYTLAVTPTSGSNVTVTVAADAATDGLNTGPASAVTATATWDAAAPTVEIGGVPAKINSTAALSVTFDFSEDVTGFVTGDVTVTGGTKGAFSGSGREYTLAVTPTSGSNVTVEVAANSATDGLNTGPASAVTATAVWDAAAPTVTIGGVPAKINSTTALSVTFDFSEAVTGFVTGDVTVAGGTKGAFSGSGRSYTLAVTPTSGSNVTVTVAADAATDGLNTGPASAVTATATWDAAAPTVEIGGVPAKINSTAALSVTFDFSEDVTGFVTGDVTVTGGTKGAFSGSGREYTLAVTPTSGSNVTVEVAANSATDGLNTGPASAVTATAVWDAAAPTVTIGGVPAKINSTTALSVTFTFSEAVTGFVTGDVTVAGGTKGAFSGSGRDYTLAVTPTSGSNVTVEVAANSATDGLNTGPASAVTATATWDAAAPEVSFASSSSSAGEDAGTRNVTVSLSPAPTAAITVNYTVGGTATAGSDFSIGGSGTLSVASGAATAAIPVAITDDAADEDNETVVLTLTTGGGYTVGSRNSHTLTIVDDDGTTPAVSLSAAPNPVDEGGPVTVTARLSEALSGGVTVPLVLTAGTAEAGDYGSLASIAIGGGQTTGTGTVTTARDADRDDETFTVALGALPSGVTPGSPSSVVVTIRDRTPPPNRPPTVTASCAPCVVGPGGTARLTATASDPDGDPLTYGWSAARGAFSGPVDEPAATWTAPDGLGRFEILVVVSDERGGTASASVEVHAVNEGPEFGQRSYRFLLPENLDGRQRPVELGTVTAEGIVFGDSERFTVGLRDGVVRYTGPGEDYETEPNIFELTVRVRDDFGADDAAKVFIEVTDENERPAVTATCEPCAVPRGGVVRLEAAATDPDGDPLTYAWSAPSGRLSDAGEPVARWTAPDELGTAAIRVEVSDGRGGTASAVVEVEVFNLAPAFGRPVYEFELPENEDGRESPVVLDRVAAEDPDGDALTYSIAAGDRDRFAVGARDGVVAYVGPGEDFETEPNLFELTVRARDAFGSEARARVVVTVTDVNELPEVTASCDPCTVPRGGEVWLEARATDPDGDPLAYGWSAAKGTFNGSVNASWAVWKAPDELGTMAIRVEVSDGRGGTASAVVEVEVVNRAPAFESPSYFFLVPENVDGRERPADLDRVAALDPDGDALSYEIVSGDRQRFAVGALDGTVRYIGPGEDFETPPNRFELVVRALDGFGGEARTEVAVEVTDVNEAPEAADDEVVTPEDRAVTVDVLANDTDPEGDRLHVRSVTAAAHGAVRLVSGGVVIYTPERDFHGADSFTYVASDGRGLRDTATVAVTVLPVNDAPTAIGRVPDQTLDEGGAPVEVDLSPYFGDVDGDALTYGARSNDTGVVEAAVAGAVLVLTPVVYGSATVTVTAWDPAGLTASQSVRVGVSDRPQRAVLGNVLAATARGHLASLRAALGRRMQAPPCEASRLAVMGRSVPLGRTGAADMLRGTWTGARSAAAAALGMGEEGLDPFGAVRLRAERGAPTALAANAVPETAERMEAALRSVPARALGVAGGGSGAGAADFLLGWGGSEQDGGRCRGRGRWSLWGQGDIQRFEGTPSADSGYDGELSTAYAGLDTRLGARWLAGVAVSRSKGVGDWRAGTSEGRLTQFMTAVHPYLRWDGRSTSIWASAGAGRGNARNARAAGRTGASPTTLRLGLVELEQRAGAPGGLDFAFLGDAAWARLRTGDGDETIDRQDIEVNQVRIGFDLSLPVRLGGLELTPSGTVHARFDGGAGQTGDGVEVAGELRAVLGIVRLDAQARMLVHHTAEGYRERGAAVTLALGGQGDEEGFSLSVSPRWGGPARASGALLRGPLGGGLRGGGPDRDRWTLDARAGYGVNLPGGLRLDLHGSYGDAGGGPGFGLSVGRQASAAAKSEG